MKNDFVVLFSATLLSTIVIPNLVHAQGSMAAAQPHIDKAKEAAWRPKDGLNDLTKLYETVCAPALDPKGPNQEETAEGGADRRKNPARSDWYQEPAKVFDNLYWLGSWGSATRLRTKEGISTGGQSTWAVTTSAGIILLDSGYDFREPLNKHWF